MAKAEHLRAHEGSSERARNRADLQRRSDPGSEDAGVTRQEMAEDIERHKELQDEVASIAAEHRHVMQAIDYQELEAGQRALDELLHHCEGLLRDAHAIKDEEFRTALIQRIDTLRFEVTLDRHAPLRSLKYHTVSSFIDTVGRETLQELTRSTYSEGDVAHANDRLHRLRNQVNRVDFEERTSLQLSIELAEWERSIARYSEDPYLFKIEKLIEKVGERHAKLPEQTKPHRDGEGLLLDDAVFRNAMRADFQRALREIATLERSVVRLTSEENRRQMQSRLRTMRATFEVAQREFENFPELLTCEMQMGELERRYESGELLTDEELEKFGEVIEGIVLARSYGGWDDEERNQKKRVQSRLKRLLHARSSGLLLREPQDESMSASIGRLIERMYGGEQGRLAWAYEELGLDAHDPEARNDDAVKKAFHNMVRRFHPDRYQNVDPTHPQAVAAEERMRRVSRAYAALKANTPRESDTEADSTAE